MKKFLVILGCLVLVAGLAGGGYYMLRKKQASKQAQVVKPTEKVEDNSQKAPEVVKRPGTYEAYDPAKFALAKDGKVVLFFNARWSVTCRDLDKQLKANTGKIPNNFTILNVDYDKNYALRKKYVVPFEDTFVQVDPEGVMVNRWSGSEEMSEVIALAK